MQWYLIFCKTDESYSIVDSDSVMNAEQVTLNDLVTFFYGSKSYVGEILNMSDDRDVLDNHVKVLGKNIKRSRKVKEEKLTVEGKRARVAKQKFSPGASSSPQTKSQKAKKKKVKELGEKVMNQLVTDLLVEEGQGDEEDNAKFKYSRNVISSSDSDEEEHLALVNTKKARKEERDQLLQKIRSETAVPSGKASTSAEHGKTVDVKSPSPTKDDLKRMILEYEAKLAVLSNDLEENSKSSEKKIIADDDDDVAQEDPAPLSPDMETENKIVEDVLPTADNLVKQDSDGNEQDDIVDDHIKKQVRKGGASDSEEQLRGKNSNNMVLLLNDIFCCDSVLQTALQLSVKPSHLARRLLEGVFKKEALLSCTLTGQKPRAAGKNNYDGQELSGLHAGAIDAICAYVKKVGKHKKWVKAECETDILRKVLSQKITELKAINRKKKKD